ncbi:MAG: HEAT repeat domain-containing protein [Acidobacteriota bacterium]
MRVILFTIFILLAVIPFDVSAVTNSNDEISRAMKMMYSNSIKKRSLARTRLYDIAKESNTDRERIIAELIEVLNDPELQDSVNKAATWYDTAYLLGDLKAEEAIDALVAHLDYNNGTQGFSLGHYPAAWALAEIGEAAIPKLREAILTNGNANIRQNAARALGKIGGEEAKTILTRALENETDEIVLFYLRRILSLQTK